MFASASSSNQNTKIYGEPSVNTANMLLQDLKDFLWIRITFFYEKCFIEFVNYRLNSANVEIWTWNVERFPEFLFKNSF